MRELIALSIVVALVALTLRRVFGRRAGWSRFFAAVWVGAVLVGLAGFVIGMSQACCSS